MDSSAQHSSGRLRIALVAMPWPLFNRPSIQLGALKAYLDQAAGDWLQVDLFHPYLALARLLGTDLYHWTSQQVWICEALYAPLLFPDRRSQAEKVVQSQLRRTTPPGRFAFTEVHERLKAHLEDWLLAVDWRGYQLIGFSVCFNQLFSSLAAASQLKAKHPASRIVFGGSFCAPAVATSILRTFSCLDYTISGEGEAPLLELCRYLAGRQEALPASVASRNNAGGTTDAPAQLSSLHELPTPDYRSYFADLRREFTGEPFIPVLPLEFSRGCWWGKCAFCNLNLQWHGYRAKRAAQVTQEVLGLSEQFGCLDFAFTDNVLPPKEASAFFQGIAQQERDFRFFAEVRAPLAREELAANRRGGLHTVQVGIEALSESLLRKMHKGARVIDNIAAMKNALSSGILMEGNLIIEFPGSEELEVKETLQNLEFVFPFQPLTTASFFLGHGSPVERHPARYGLQAVTQHPHYARLLPREVLAGLTLLIKDYRGDRLRQRKRWAPVVAKVKRWQQYHRQRRNSPCTKPVLSYRDGGHFLVIRQELPEGRTLHHRLRGPSRQIYLFCRDIRSLKEIKGQFPTLDEPKLKGFLEDLRSKRLLFRQEDEFLSLAVRER